MSVDDNSIQYALGQAHGKLYARIQELEAEIARMKNIVKQETGHDWVFLEISANKRLAIRKGLSQ